MKFLKIKFKFIIISGLICLICPQLIFCADSVGSYNLYSPTTNTLRSIIRHQQQKQNRKRLKKSEIFPNIRLHYFKGEVKSGVSELKNYSIAAYWKKWGLGHTKSGYKSRSLNSINYSANTDISDIIYTFGKKWTLSFGISIPTNGEAKITFLNHKYTSTSISGYGINAGIGINLWFFEILMRKTALEYEYSNFLRDKSITLKEGLKIKADVLSLGIGLNF